jgi:benzoate/toluate 1,2-dioxygenase subunit alpha
MDVASFACYLDDRPADGVFRVRRDIYTDRQLFELEMKHIFERTWNYVAFESEMARPHDFVTRHIGRTPVIVSRDAKGTLGAFVNACRHKGATVCRVEEGNAKYHVCPYHGWAYDSAGRNVDIKDRAAGAYSEAFEADSHDLVAVPKLGIYKGMIFASLSADVPPIDEYLAGIRPFLDLHLEQSPHGMEMIPGRAVYMYRGNWKLQLENALDPYHVTTTHACLAVLQQRRRAGKGYREADRQDWNERERMDSGGYEFRYGHSATWNGIGQPERRPLYAAMDELRSRVGAQQAEWMLYQRNGVLFPNLQVSDAVAPILRTIRPIAVDLTELRSFIIAPAGEAPEMRVRRLRQFEDSINPSGYATPDDMTVYTECQRGFAGTPLDWLQGHARGGATRVEGADDKAREIGMEPLASIYGPKALQQETNTYPALREWARLLQAGITGASAYP